MHLARAGFFATGIATALMGAYHLYLPTHMQWNAGLDGVPGMIRWGLFAINSDFSVLLVLIGLLVCVQAMAEPPRSAVERLFVFVPAVFWLWHQAYLRRHAMPIPETLNDLRLALEAFGVIVLAGAVVCPLIMVLNAKESIPVRKRFVFGAGLVVGSFVMGVVVAVVLWSMSTLKGPPEPDPPSLAISSAETDADRLGVASLDALSSSPSLRVFKQSTSITDDQYLAAWPDVAEDLNRAPEIDPMSEDPARLNLHARHLLQSGDFEAANQVIARAIEFDPEHALHQLQAGMIALGAMNAEQQPMKRWPLSVQTQNAMEAALRLDPDLSAARLYVVYTLELAPRGFGGDPQRAMTLLNEAIERGDSEFLPVRARIRLRRGERQAGLDDALRAMAEGVYHPATFTRASDAALKSDDNDNAVRFASFAVRMEPKNIENWRALSIALTASGDQVRADRVDQFIAERTQ